MRKAFPLYIPCVYLEVIVLTLHLLPPKMSLSSVIVDDNIRMKARRARNENIKNKSGWKLEAISRKGLQCCQQQQQHYDHHK
jgi:hypothetical protein